MAVVTTTLGSAQAAHTLAATLVEERLAACVHVFPVTSRYRWEGEVRVDAEWRCEAKTARSRVEHLMARIAELHTYDTPEVVVTAVEGGDARYLAWVNDEVDGG